jgi:hypothetical protein
VKRPTMKKEVAISVVSETVRAIYFYATQDAASEFAEFGQMGNANGTNHYRLEVDARFDFQEVVSFIRDYGSQNETSPFDKESA